MLEVCYLDGGRGRFELDSLHREVTPEPAMQLGIRLHLPEI